MQIHPPPQIYLVMLTKDVIKMVQEADPSGECHVRLTDGIPIAAELKEGYWDGSYSYFDKDGNYVTSVKGNKVDIHCLDLDEFVSNKTFNGDTWENIKNSLKFEFDGYYPNQAQEKINNILKLAKEYFDSIKKSLVKYKL